MYYALCIHAFIHIYEHLSLHTIFWEAFRPPYTPGSFCLITVIKCLKGHKSLRTLCDGPGMLIEWKFESMTNFLTYWLGLVLETLACLKKDDQSQWSKNKVQKRRLPSTSKYFPTSFPGLLENSPELTNRHCFQPHSSRSGLVVVK